MKKLVIILTAVCSISVLTYATDRKLNLPESITTGLHNSQKLLALYEEISISQSRITEARALTYPKIDYNMNILKFENDTPTILPPLFGTTLYVPQGIQGQYYSTRFTMYQYLYAGGRYSTNLRVAETNLAQANGQADSVKNEIIRDIKKTYYGFIAAQEKKQLYVKTYESAGKFSEYAKQLSFNIEKAGFEFEKAKLDYLKTIGLELNTEIEVTGTLTAPSAEYDLNKCLAWAQQYRPELKQIRFQETIDSLRVSLSLTERLPTITLGANYEWLGQDFPSTNRNWTAAINLNLPIFDGGAYWSKLKQRRINVRQNQILQAESEDQVELEVRKSFLEYNFWKKRYSDMEAQKNSENDAKENLNWNIIKLETLQQLLSSHAELEWAIGKPLSELK